MARRRAKEPDLGFGSARRRDCEPRSENSSKVTTLTTRMMEMEMKMITISIMTRKRTRKGLRR